MLLKSAALLVAVAALAGCGGSSKETAPTTTAQASTLPPGCSVSDVDRIVTSFLAHPQLAPPPFFELYAAYDSDGRKFVTKKRAVALAHLRARVAAGERARLLSLRVNSQDINHARITFSITRFAPDFRKPRHPHASGAGRRHDRLRPRAGRGMGDERPLSRPFADTCARKVSCYDPCGIKYLSPEEEPSMSTIEQTQQSIPTGTWQADTVHSRVAFEVPYAVATFSGEVPDFEASLVDGQLKGVAKIASIQVKEENLQAHLLSPEFFDAERHPEVTFVSKKITP